MRLVISVGEGAVEGELRSLHDWLMTDRTVRRGALAELASAEPPEPGRQSSAVDILSLVLSSGFSTASLGVSIANWRATRPQHPTVTVERPDGTKVSISGAAPDVEQHLMHRLLNPEP
ncbi:effector-associated constant component EACC1 [Streptomyces sp. NPDC054863]